MHSTSGFLIGTAVGAALALAFFYLFSPDNADEIQQNQNRPYLSRLDAALEAGRQAALAREAQLLQSFEEARTLSHGEIQ